MSPKRLAISSFSLAVMIFQLGSIQAQTNILSNSSFENWTGTPGTLTFTGTPPVSTSVSSWRIIAPSLATLPGTNPGSILTNTNYNQSAGGTYSLYISTNTGVTYLTQNVSLTNGQSYRLAFDTIMTGSTNPGNMTVDAFISNPNLTTPAALQSFALPASASSTASMQTSWTTQVTTSDLLFTQASGTYDLTFALTAPGTTAKDISIDRISLLATPEPGSFVAIGSAVCALLYRRFKKRGSASIQEVV